jgi:hypothetical protein
VHGAAHIRTGRDRARGEVVERVLVVGCVAPHARGCGRLLNPAINSSGIAFVRNKGQRLRTR